MMATHNRDQGNIHSLGSFQDNRGKVSFREGRDLVNIKGSRDKINFRVSLMRDRFLRVPKRCTRLSMEYRAL